MERKEITVEEFTAAMEAAVEERGRDYIYPPAVERDMDSDYEVGPIYYDDEYHYGDGGCVYQTAEGVPACIIGVVLDKLGLDVPAYGAMNDARVVLEARTTLPSYVLRAARQAQNEQDHGQPWGQALDTYYVGVSA